MMPRVPITGEQAAKLRLDFGIGLAGLEMPVLKLLAAAVVYAANANRDVVPRARGAIFGDSAAPSGGWQLVAAVFDVDEDDAKELCSRIGFAPDRDILMLEGLNGAEEAVHA